VIIELGQSSAQAEVGDGADVEEKYHTAPSVLATLVVLLNFYLLTGGPVIGWACLGAFTAHVHD